MPIARGEMEQLHRDLAWCAGQLALMLEKRKMRFVVLHQIQGRLKNALTTLEK